MNIPVWIKPAAYGAAIGGVVVAIVGFSWGGWVSGGSALASANAAALQSRTDLASAICVQNFMADENARANLNELKALRDNQQRTYLEEGTWAIMPDQDAVTRDTAILCARMLSALEPEELPVVENQEVVEPGIVIDPEESSAPLDAEPAIEDPA
ncbi:hypothetical protein [Pelagibacterium lentulum]|uniref:Uncharacterized protein n=1 Tax=Pelagibacterium lentulum TaxID=2029865 RepID=A0A916RAG5_9HYPH|nr:hypothetical protein [Pelagibacterium lentulum]GGA41505.1 hypothetical protein GCM10011499_08930 [Pelagibacterium lentulum]